MKSLLMALSVTVGLLGLPTGSFALSFTKSYATVDGRELGLVFDEGTGLSGLARFRLGPDGSGNDRLEILLTNTSSAAPAGADVPADLILTSVYFDLGGPGATAGDPFITGGEVWVADGSQMVGPANKIKAYDDLSAWWGHGNTEYEEFEFLGPNFVSSRGSHATAFDDGGKLNGPDYGVASAVPGIADLYTSQPVVLDTVRVVVDLDQPLEDLSAIIAPGNDTAYIEFGSNYDFFADDVPPHDEPPQKSPPIPEPATACAALLGGGTLLAYLRRRTRPA